MARTAATERAAVAASRCKAADDKKSDNVVEKKMSKSEKHLCDVTERKMSKGEMSLRNNGKPMPVYNNDDTSDSGCNWNSDDASSDDDYVPEVDDYYDDPQFSDDDDVSDMEDEDVGVSNPETIDQYGDTTVSVSRGNVPTNTSTVSRRTRQPHNCFKVTVQTTSTDSPVVRHNVNPQARFAALHRHLKTDWVVVDNLDVPNMQSSCKWVYVSNISDPMIKKVPLPKTRLKTFMHKCCPTSVSAVLQAKVCASVCSLQCSHHTTLASVLQKRIAAHKQTSGCKVVEHVTRALKQCNLGYVKSTESERPKRLSYSIEGRKVCSRFWAFMYGVSEDRMKVIRGMVRDNHVLARNGNEGRNRTTPQYDICYSFWDNFFQIACSQPNNELLLFPVNMSLRFIYKENFQPWYDKQMLLFAERHAWAEDDIPWIPSETTFIRARWNQAFNMVTARPRHYHALCDTCRSLRERQIKGFLDGAHKQKWKVTNTYTYLHFVLLFLVQCAVYMYICVYTCIIFNICIRRCGSSYMNRKNYVGGG
jgi:hypothetical protein